MARDDQQQGTPPIEVQVGQLFVVQPDPALGPRDALGAHLENYFGGFFLKPDNLRSIDEARALTRRMGRHWRRLPPPIIAVDEEGGLVSDTRHLTTAAPSAAALGVIDDPEVTQDVHEGIARKLRALGVNTVFAPVLDVNSEERNPVIGIRAFGSTARAVSRHGIAALKGLRAGGVASCAKHFPGHGATVLDSHLTLPVLEADRNTLTDRELAPFVEAFEQQAPDMLMTAHVAYPALGDKKTPATLSRQILRDLLRGELGFKGLVITDAMEMRGITDLMPPERAAVEAILAGADLLLYAGDRAMAAAAYKGVLEAVKGGKIPLDRIEESLQRIYALRRGFQAHSWLNDEEAYDILDVDEEQAFFQAALDALEVEGNVGVLPRIAGAEGAKLVVLPREASPGRPLDLEVVREQLAPLGFEILETAVEPTPEELALAEGRAAEASVVVVGTASRGPMSPTVEKLVAAVTRRDVIKVGVALLNPADADRMMSANCRFRLHGATEPHLWAMCQKLLG